MNKLSKLQRDQLLGIAMGTVALMVALWYFGVKAKERELRVARQKTAEMRKSLSEAEDLMKRGDEFDGTLRSSNERLHKLEAGLAPERVAYEWVINTVNAFIQSRNGVNIDSYSQPEISDMGIIPRFPYRWATFHLKGTGYYHDLGKFFADFEKAFPYFRIQDPILAVNSGPGMEPEKLSVTFDIVAPVISPDTK